MTRLPRPARMEEYEDAAREMEELLAGLPGIVAVYRTGGVSMPGISDIDRIAVVESRGPLPQVWHRLAPRTRELAMHGPLLVDLATFRRHLWFAHLEPLELVSGSAVDLDERPLPSYSEPLIAAESMTVSLLSTVKQVATGMVKVRPTLCQLNNLRHALALATLDREQAAAAHRLAGQVETLRSAWFGWSDADRTERVTALVHAAAPALHEALAAVGRQTTPPEAAPGGLEDLPLGAPWSGVVLTPDTGGEAVSGTPRLRLPFARSARLAELRWRMAQPRLALSEATLALLAGRGGEKTRRFRSARYELVRDYRDFVARNSEGYSPIGLAFPFLGT